MSEKQRLEKAIINFQKWGWRQGVNINTKLHDLSYFFWETTLRCNLSCKHCGSDCSKDSALPELTSDKVLQVFRDIAQNYNPQKIMVAVTGGEPLVREDLFDVLSEVSNMGFPWGMVTNGMLVTDEIVQKCIDSGMKTVSVSLDGPSEAHNWLRNSEVSYERAINALKLFVDSDSLDTVEAITCVNFKNIDSLDEMYEILKAIGVKEWRLFTIFPKGRAEKHKDLILNKELLVKLFSFIKEKREVSPIMQVSYSEEGYLNCEWERNVRDDFFYCGAGINVGSLLSDGTFSACPSLSREWSQGHVDEISFHEAWENRYKNMRDRSWMKTGHCSACREWKNCNGSSLHLWDWNEGKTKVCHFRMLDS